MLGLLFSRPYNLFIGRSVANIVSDIECEQPVLCILI
jgi:hypothetical protein